MNYSAWEEENYYSQLIHPNMIHLSSTTMNSAERSWKHLPPQYSYGSWRTANPSNYRSKFEVNKKRSNQIRQDAVYSRREPYIERTRKYYDGRSHSKGRIFKYTTNQRPTSKSFVPTIQQEKRYHNKARASTEQKGVISELCEGTSVVATKRTKNDDENRSKTSVGEQSEESITKSPEKRYFENNSPMNKVIGTSDENEKSNKIYEGTPENRQKQTQKNDMEISERKGDEQKQCTELQLLEKNISTEKKLSENVGIAELDEIKIKSQDINFENINTVVKITETCYKNGTSSKINDSTPDEGFKQGERNDIIKSEIKGKEEALEKTEHVEITGIESHQRNKFQNNLVVSKLKVSCGRNKERFEITEGSPEKVLQGTNNDEVNESKKMKVSEKTHINENFRQSNKMSIYGKIKTTSETNVAPPAKRLKFTENCNLKQLEPKETESNRENYAVNNSIVNNETDISGENEILPQIKDRVSEKQESIRSETDEIKLNEETTKSHEIVNQKNKKPTVDSVAWPTTISSLGFASDHDNVFEKTDFDSRNSLIEKDYRKEDISVRKLSNEATTEASIPVYDLSRENKDISIVSKDLDNDYEESQMKSANTELSQISTNETDPHKLEILITEDNAEHLEKKEYGMHRNKVFSLKETKVEEIKLNHIKKNEISATTYPIDEISERYRDGMMDSAISSSTSLSINVEINRTLHDPRSRPKSKDQSNKIPLLLKLPNFWSRLCNKTPKIKYKSSICNRNLNELKKFSNISPKDMLSFCCYVMIRKNECKTVPPRQLSDSCIHSLTETNKTYLGPEMSKKAILGCDKEKIMNSRNQLANKSSEEITDSTTYLAHERTQKKLGESRNLKIDGISKNRRSGSHRKKIISDNNGAKQNIKVKESEKYFRPACAVEEARNKEKVQNSNDKPSVTNNLSFHIPKLGAIGTGARDSGTCSNIEVEMSSKAASPLGVTNNTEYTLHIPENNFSASFYDGVVSDIDKSQKSSPSKIDSYSTIDPDSNSRHDNVTSNYSNDKGCNKLIQVKGIDGLTTKVHLENNPMIDVDFSIARSSRKTEQDSLQYKRECNIFPANNLEIREKDTPKSPRTGYDCDKLLKNIGEIVQHPSNASNGSSNSVRNTKNIVLKQIVTTKSNTKKFEIRTFFPQKNDDQMNHTVVNDIQIDGSNDVEDSEETNERKAYSAKSKINDNEAKSTSTNIVGKMANHSQIQDLIKITEARDTVETAVATAKWKRKSHEPVSLSKEHEGMPTNNSTNTKTIVMASRNRISGTNDIKTQTEDNTDMKYARMQDTGSSDTINAETKTGAAAKKKFKDMPLLEEADDIENHTPVVQNEFSRDMKIKDDVINKTNTTETVSSSYKALPNEFKTSTEKVSEITEPYEIQDVRKNVMNTAEKMKINIKETLIENAAITHTKGETSTTGNASIDTKEQNTSHGASNITDFPKKTENSSAITPNSQINKTKTISSESICGITKYLQIPCHNVSNIQSNSDDMSKNEHTGCAILEGEVNPIEAEASSIESAISISKTNDLKTSSNTINASYENMRKTANNVQRQGTSNNQSIDTTAEEEKERAAKGICNFDLRVDAYGNLELSEVPTKNISPLDSNQQNYSKIIQKELTNISKNIQTQFSTQSSKESDVEVDKTTASLVAPPPPNRMPTLAGIPTRNLTPHQPGLYAFIRYRIYRILNSYILLNYQLVSVIESLKTMGLQFNMTPDLSHIRNTSVNVRDLHGSFLLDCLHSLTPRLQNSNLIFNSILLYLSQMIQNPKSKPMISRYIYELVSCHASRYAENDTLRNFKDFIENDLAAQKPVPGRNITSEQYVLLRSQIFEYLTFNQVMSNKRSDQQMKSKSKINTQQLNHIRNNLKSASINMATNSEAINSMKNLTSRNEPYMGTPPVAKSTNFPNDFSNVSGNTQRQTMSNLQCSLASNNISLGQNSQYYPHNTNVSFCEPPVKSRMTRSNPNDRVGPISNPSSTLQNIMLSLHRNSYQDQTRPPNSEQNFPCQRLSCPISDNREAGGPNTVSNIQGMPSTIDSRNCADLNFGPPLYEELRRRLNSSNSSLQPTVSSLKDVRISRHSSRYNSLNGNTLNSLPSVSTEMLTERARSLARVSSQSSLLNTRTRRNSPQTVPDDRKKRKLSTMDAISPISHVNPAYHQGPSPNISNILIANSGKESTRRNEVPDWSCNRSPFTTSYPTPPSSNNSMQGTSPSPRHAASPALNPTFPYPSPPISNVSSPPVVLNANDKLRNVVSFETVENTCNAEFPVGDELIDVKPSPSLLVERLLRLKDEPDDIIDLTFLDDTKGEDPESYKDVVDESMELLILNNRECLCGNPAEYLCACNTVMYCSDSCQLKDWSNHQRVCSGVSTQANKE